MERRTALAASIATGVSLTFGVVAFAAIGGASILGLGGGSGAGAGRAADPLVVHQVQTIEDEIVVSSRSTDVPRPVEHSGATASGAASNPAPAFDGITVSIGPSAANVAPVAPAAASGPAALEDTAPLPGDGTPNASTTPAVSAAPSSSVNPTPVSTNPPSTAPASTGPASTAPATNTPATTTPSPTTAARPPGVPADWPANQPIPPMPADCQQPQLEDNGVWNCDH